MVAAAEAADAEVVRRTELVIIVTQQGEEILILIVRTGEIADGCDSVTRGEKRFADSRGRTADGKDVGGAGRRWSDDWAGAGLKGLAGHEIGSRRRTENGVERTVFPLDVGR